MPAIETTPDARRSAAMRAVKPTGTAPEEALASALVGIGATGFSRNDRSLPGSPDFAFRGARFAVFVDSAFWHGKGALPKTNRKWWREKFRRNRARDKRDVRELRALGWRAFRIDAGFCLRRPAVAAMLVERERRRGR